MLLAEYLAPGAGGALFYLVVEWMADPATDRQRAKVSGGMSVMVPLEATLHPDVLLCDQGTHLLVLAVSLVTFVMSAFLADAVATCSDSEIHY